MDDIYFSDNMLDVAEKNGGYAGAIFKNSRGYVLKKKQLYDIKQVIVENFACQNFTRLINKKFYIQKNKNTKRISSFCVFCFL